MKTVVAIVIVSVALVASEPPRFRGSARQTAPGGGGGWQQQQQPQQAYGPPKPKPSYGPPPQEPTTDDYQDDPTVPTTQSPQFAKITSKERNIKTSSTLKQSRESYFVVLPQNSVVISEPQSQNLVYAVTEVKKSSPLVAGIPQATILAAPLNSAQLQLQTLPVSTFKSLYSPSPLAASYVQVPQQLAFL